ncbi:MAG: class I SAM-dependent methyltransferase [Chloroflexi bacterium]|nr:class I SAM-dependent methyltransferase [Chloroflexota bacterium]
MNSIPSLKFIPREEYIAIDKYDPLRFYFWPILGKMYRNRVELCLNECKGGEKILDVGYGSGINFPNLNEKYAEIHGLDLYSDPKRITEIFAKHKISTHLQQGDVLKMPYPDDYFDTIILISILEHLKPEKLPTAFQEIFRVVKRGGQVVYGVPVERKLMRVAFWLLGANIHEHHFSTQDDILFAARELFEEKKLIKMKSIIPSLGQVYQIGHFKKAS